MEEFEGCGEYFTVVKLAKRSNLYALFLDYDIIKVEYTVSFKYSIDDFVMT